ncbi:hypothetical protein [Chlamydiifrater volucris]|nr:hypothetical protein [Chlamydiifrater volucris]
MGIIFSKYEISYLGYTLSLLEAMKRRFHLVVFVIAEKSFAQGLDVSYS